MAAEAELNPYLQLVPSLWAEGFHLELVEFSNADPSLPWVYAIVCDCCGETKYEGNSDECRNWLQPMIIEPINN